MTFKHHTTYFQFLSFTGDVICMDDVSYHTQTEVVIPNSKSGKTEYIE